MVARRVYLFCFFDDLMLIYPFYVLLFLDHGLNNFEISVCIAAWSIIGLVMEVPSGAWADRYDRRHVLAAGCVAKTLGLALWVIAPGFWGYLIGLGLWGLQGAMVSGTFEALLYDALKERGQEDRYITINGRASTASFIGVIISAGVAALSVRPGYESLLYGSILVSALSIGTAMWLPSAPKSGQVEDSKYFILLRAGLREAFGSRLLLLPIAVLAFATASEEGFSDYVSLFSSDVGLSETGVAVAFMVIVGAAAIGGVLADRITGTSLYRPVILLLVGGVVLFAAAQLGNVAGLGLLALFFFFTQMSTISSDAVLQDSISGPARATVTSVPAFMSHMANVFIYLAFGLIADAFDRFVAFAVGGITVAVLSVILLAGVWRWRIQPTPA